MFSATRLGRLYIATGLGTAALVWLVRSSPHARFAARRIEPGVLAQDTFVTRDLRRGNGKMSVLLFTDYQCSKCRLIANWLDSLKNERQDLQVIELQLPDREYHYAAFDAAMAAECGKVFGRGARVHNVLDRHHNLVDAERWTAIARVAGIADSSAFENCIHQRRFQGSIDHDSALAARLGVSGAPALIVNGTLLTGDFSTQDVLAFLK